MLLSKKSTRFKFLLLIFFAIFFGFCFASQIYASTSFTVAPSISVESIKISTPGNNQITGEFTVKNYETYYLSDLNYEIKLFQGTKFAELKLVDSLVFNEAFSVPPGQTINKSFTYTYPKNITSGDYNLRIQILTARGGFLGWKSQVVSLKGQNKFLQILPNSSKVLVDGKEYTTLEGIGIDPTKQKVVAYLKIKNLGDAITVIPNVKIFNRQVNMPVANEYQDSPITFQKGETKEIKLEMLSPTKPESYLAEVKFLNNNEQVSGTENFRWVVMGTSGKILNVKADKDYFKAGENINLTVETIGPADLSGIGTGSLEVSVYDGNNLVGKTSKDVALNASSVSSIISIPVKSDLVAPKIDVKLITKDGKTLDEQTINLPVFSPQAKKIQSSNKYFIYMLLAVIIAIILIAGFVFYKLKLHYTK